MKKIGMLVLVFLAGCAYIDQNLRVSPQLTVLEANIGQDKKVALRVVDDRSEQLIGRRAGGYGYGMAKITTDQDLAEILRNAFIKGLRKKGFEPVEMNDPGVSLRVELRSLAYDTSMGFWTGGNIGNAAIKIIASQPSGKTYEKTYRGQREVQTVFIGSQETNTDVVNGALSDVLGNVFSDRELLDFLTQ